MRRPPPAARPRAITADVAAPAPAPTTATADAPARASSAVLVMAMIAMAMSVAAPATVRAQEPVATGIAADTAAELTAPVSAAGAFARSLLLPGWGQAYVGAPARGAIYFAMEAGSAWMTYKTWRQLREARDLQEWLRESGRLSATEKLDVLDSREQQFEDWLTLSIFLLLFSGVDAYVTAQLADFDEHVGVYPGVDGGMSLEARVPIGPPR